MTDYNPPTQNLPIFDKLVFINPNDYITIANADKRYLRYPSAQGTETLQAIIVNGTSTLNSTLTMNNRSNSINRTISSSYYDITDKNVNGSLNKVGSIYVSTADMYIENTANSSMIRFRTKNGSGTTITPMVLTDTEIATEVDIVMGTDNGIDLSGTGKIRFLNTTNTILQTVDTYINGEPSNLMRKTIFSINNNAASPIAGANPVAIVDKSVSPNPGFAFMPNASTAGAFNSMFQLKDSGIVTATENNDYSSITMAPWSTVRTGFRASATTSTTASTTMGCGSQSLIFTTNTVGPVNTCSLDINQFDIRSISNTNSRLEILPSTNNIYIKARPPSGVGILYLNAYNGSTDEEIMNLRGTFIQVRRPINFSYLTEPTTLGQLGFVRVSNLGGPWTISASQTGMTNLTSFSVPNAGTYSIIVNISIAGGATQQITEMIVCLSDTTASLPNWTTPSLYSTAIYGTQHVNLTSTTLTYAPLNLNIKLTGSTTIYVNTKIVYTGGGSLTLNGVCTTTRIG